MEELSRRYPRGCPTGSAVITSAGNLPARYVVHAVGPAWQGGQSGEPDLLAGAYRTALHLAAEHNCKSVALPAISCGIYGYPVDLASQIALRVTTRFLEQDPTIELARFVLFGEGMYGAFAHALDKLV
jgi:O-acetyl-ADP-ribose deacetylase (regulator of RNase III)